MYHMVFVTLSYYIITTEVRALQSNLTLDEIRIKDVKLRTEASAHFEELLMRHPNIFVVQVNILYLQVHEMEEKLKKLRSGTVLVKPEDKKLIQEKYNENINQWRKRKRMFKELWDTITESSTKDIKEFKVYLIGINAVLSTCLLRKFHETKSFAGGTRS